MAIDFPIKEIFLQKRKRMKIVYQSETSECALACIAMILAYHGNQTSLEELRASSSISMKGASLRAVIDVSARLGFLARPIRIDLDEVDKIKLPALLHWNLNHYVVLAKVGKAKLTIYDPARGERVISYKEMSQSFTGIVLELAPDAVDQKKPKETLSLRRMISGISGIWPFILQLTLLTIVTQAVSVVLPVINQVIVDQAIANHDGDLLTTLAIGLLVLTGITVIIGVLRGLISLYLGTQLSFQLESRLMSHLLRLPIEWSEKRHLGDITSRFGSLGPVKSFISGSVISTVISISALIFSCTMMLLYAPILFVVEASFVIFLVAFRLLFISSVKDKTENGIYLAAKSQSVFLETLRAIRAFKIFGRENERLTLWQSHQSRVIANDVSLSKLRVFGDAGTSIVSGLQSVIMLWLGGRKVMHGEMSLGMLFAFRAYADQFNGAVGGIVSQVGSYISCRMNLKRVSEVMLAEPESNLLSSDRRSADLRGSISLRQIRFRYANYEPWILDGISLEIAENEFVCLTGPSGQGKTTLLKLLIGIMSPVHGEIFYDGLSAESLRIENFRGQIGVVMQDDMLVAGTLADNICFFEPGAEHDDIVNAATLANIHNEIMAMPMGYLTLVGDIGSALSGGQRQRLLIARALYRKPKILFFDEGTSNLDQENENVVLDVIKALSMTRVLVAHRKAAIDMADRVLEVSNGAVNDVMRHES
ncbi:peptidase domain-containing ABC transporter [Xanthomonas campestris pv. paulliniae]|uniref:peptidase domain-containing ABC transporter n=1 Tax=Xanthomonas euvesicatoria TaxID=456327 RepID=UPI001C44D7EA|nr:peptidase domain-containing ABC transporter [Xanthomonas euvesicatoria]MBV6845780.1 peptidase domain-containing ABC transporter [Xanthomonas campestris pv. paulliniae]